jgi:hypothetical protein
MYLPTKSTINKYPFVKNEIEKIFLREIETHSDRERKQKKKSIQVFYQRYINDGRKKKT